MTRAALLAALCAASCSNSAELTLDIRKPADTSFAAVTQLNLVATRQNVVLAQASFDADASYVSLASVSHGSSTVITLDGVSSLGDVVARGRTCPIVFAGEATAALYFRPTNTFSPTINAPFAQRSRPIAVALDSGNVLIAGGSDTGGAVIASAEMFAPGLATFSAAAAAPLKPRARAEAVAIGSIGVLITGGVDESGARVADAEWYSQSLGQFSAITSARLDARVGHRLVALPNDEAIVIGGEDGAPLATTVTLVFQSDGSYQVSEGPMLAEARSDHAAVLAASRVLVFGGTGAAGTAIDSIEAIDPTATATATPPAAIAHLTIARTGATASQLPDGSILLVGGKGMDGKPLDSAELFDPVSRTTTVFTMDSPRRGHTATVLASGRVLVAGGTDQADTPLAKVELFDPDSGFVTERSLRTPRSDHVAVPLCDGTVLLTGGAAGAELYSPSAR